MELNEEQIKAIAVATVAEMQNHTPCSYCRSDEGRTKHEEEHRFLESMIAISNKWDGVRWELLRDILKWVNRILVTAMIMGLLFMAVKTGGGVNLK